MRLLEVGIKNFKSLRDVIFKPGDLTVLIGPNGAGKSNLVQVLDFIGEMYRSALNVAMTTHGGYESLIYRGTSESTTGMRFKIVASLSKHDLRQTWHGQPNPAAPHELTLCHKATISPGSRPGRRPV